MKLREQWRSKKGLKAHVISCIWALKSVWLGKIKQKGSDWRELYQSIRWETLLASTRFPHVGREKLIQKMEVKLTAPKYWMDWKGGRGGKQDFQVLGLSNWVDSSTSTEIMKRRRRMGWGQDRQCWGGTEKGCMCSTWYRRGGVV